MPTTADTMVLKFREVLAATETLAPDALAAYQANLLTPLVRHARNTTRFYGSRLAPLGTGDAVDLSRWSEVPILTRAEAQAQTAAMTAASVPPALGAVGTDETSGSTGRPLLFSSCALQTVAARALTDRLFRWWGFDGNSTMATYISRRKVPAPAPDGVTHSGWRLGYPAGQHHLLDMSADTDLQLDWLVKRQPRYLTAYSSTLRPLAERARERGVSVPLDRIIGVSSQLSEETRALCREVFGATVVDLYGADEAGTISTECPHCGQYHIAAETVLVEIVDASGNACKAGETGRVVITPLYAYATVLIRYEIGDFATVGDDSRPCAIRLPTLARIVGRFRNTFRLADGRIIYPLFSVAKLKEIVPLQQFQVVQTRYDRVEVRYVPLASGAVANHAALTAFLRQEIHPSIEVSAVPVNTIARSPSGKFEDFVSLVEQSEIKSPLA